MEPQFRADQTTTTTNLHQIGMKAVLRERVGSHAHKWSIDFLKCEMIVNFADH